MTRPVLSEQKGERPLRPGRGIIAVRDGSEGAPRTTALAAIHSESQARLSSLLGPRRPEPALRRTGSGIAGDMPLSLLIGFSSLQAWSPVRLPAFARGRLIAFAGLASDLLALFGRHGDMRCFECGKVIPRPTPEKLLVEISSKLDSGVIGLAHPLEKNAQLGEWTHERLIVGASLVDAEALGKEGVERTLSGDEPVSLVLKTYSLPLTAEGRLEIRDRITRAMRQPDPNLEIFHFPRGKRSATRLGSLGSFLACSGCGKKVDAPRTNEAECAVCRGKGEAEGARCKVCAGSGLEPAIGSLSLVGLRPLDLTATSIATMNTWLRSLVKASDDPAVSRSARALEILGRLGFGHHRLSLELDRMSDGEKVRLTIALLALERLSDTTILFEDSLCVFPENELAAYWPVLESIATDNLVLVSTRSEAVSARADDVFAAVDDGATISLSPRVSEPEHMISRSESHPETGAAVQIFQAPADEALVVAGISIEIPSGVLVALSGETGSGKTILLRDVIGASSPPTMAPGGAFFFEKAQYLGSDDDSLPSLDRTLASVSGVFEAMLEKIASSYEGRLAGFEPALLGKRDERFVCRECGGSGKTVVPPSAPGLSAVIAPCPVCLGGRFTSVLTGLKLRNRGLDEILEMTVSDARSAYWNEKGLIGDLGTLEKVGFGSTRLGKSTLEMSRSERQRLRIVRALRGRLKKGSRGKGAKPRLFLLDYPFVGMSTRDIDATLSTLREGTYRGDSFVIAANDPDVIAACDLHYEAAVQVDRILPRAYTYTSQNRKSIVRLISDGR